MVRNQSDHKTQNNNRRQNSLVFFVLPFCNCKGTFEQGSSGTAQWPPDQTGVLLRLHLHFRAFSRGFCPKRLTVIHTDIHTLMAVAAMQGVDQHIRSSLGDQYLAQGHFADQGNQTSDLLITRLWNMYFPLQLTWSNTGLQNIHSG